MLINCPDCSASYHIAQAACGLNGRKVACPRCEAVWLARPPAGTETAAQVFAAGRLQPVDPSEYARSISAPAAASIRPHVPDAVKSFCAGALFLVLATALIALRGTVTQALPQAARFYAMVGIPVAESSLAIRDLRTEMTHIDGAPYLGIEGVIANPQAHEIAVPPLRLIIRDAHKNQIYTWTVAAGRSKLAAGASLLFHARLAAPPEDGRDVIVRFAPAIDTIASR